MRYYSLLIILTFVVAPGHLFAEPPPLSKKEMESQSDRIVTGTVTEVKVGQPRANEYSTEYDYELTVLVDAVTKGQVEEGATLTVRGSFIKLKPGAVGGSGHRSDNTGHRLNAIKPGWKLLLHLAVGANGDQRILAPNGFAVVAAPAGPEPEVSFSPWPGIVCVGAVLGVVLLIGILLNRLNSALQVFASKTVLQPEPVIAGDGLTASARARSEERPGRKHGRSAAEGHRMASTSRRWWWLPGGLLAAVGVAALVGGLATGGPDAVGGVVFGGLALAAAGVILHRRSRQVVRPPAENAAQGDAADWAGDA